MFTFRKCVHSQTLKLKCSSYGSRLSKFILRLTDSVGSQDSSLRATVPVHSGINRFFPAAVYPFTTDFSIRVHSTIHHLVNVENTSPNRL